MTPKTIQLLPYTISIRCKKPEVLTLSLNRVISLKQQVPKSDFTEIPIYSHTIKIGVNMVKHLLEEKFHDEVREHKLVNSTLLSLM